MAVKIEPSWKQRLECEFAQPYFNQLTTLVRQEYRQYSCYPPGPLIFNAFNLCPFDKVKVVIIGQDPYHEPGQAMGLSFSVPDGIPMPPSLINIFREISSDLGKAMPTTGNLTRWAQQGVMLLNATLTVRAHQAGSHQRMGWETFTDAVIRSLNAGRETSSSSSGAVMPAARQPSSTARGISSLSRCIPRPSPPTAAGGSATIISHAPMPSMPLTAWNLSTGKRCPSTTVSPSFK